MVTPAVISAGLWPESSFGSGSPTEALGDDDMVNSYKAFSTSRLVCFAKVLSKFREELIDPSVDALLRCITLIVFIKGQSQKEISILCG